MLSAEGGRPLCWFMENRPTFLTLEEGVLDYSKLTWLHLGWIVKKCIYRGTFESTTAHGFRTFQMFGMFFCFCYGFWTVILVVVRPAL